MNINLGWSKLFVLIPFRYDNDCKFQISLTTQFNVLEYILEVLIEVGLIGTCELWFDYCLLEFGVSSNGLHYVMDVMIISPDDRSWTYCAIFLFRETKPNKSDPSV